MPELTDDQVKAIQETHNTVLIIKTVLLGANGDKGLVGKVEDSCDRIDVVEGRQNEIDNRLVRQEVRSGIYATVAAGLGSFLALFRGN